ncbi:Listeria-Bacteroides repeat domain [Bacteroidales bacterium Barb7]|nr:Listeria-Bacteroides repeat domain [Bacteroidales bacterium Barb7]
MILSAGENGTIKSGEGIYVVNTEATVEARENYDYHFVNWTNAKGEIISSSNPYTFIVKSETAIQANFAPSIYQVNVFAATYNGTILPKKNEYAYGTEVEVEAVADSGYHLAKWANAQGDSLSDDNPYRFVVKGPMTVQAYFAGNSHSVRLSAGENGTIKSGGGICPYGSETTIEAAADTGYHFAKWTNAKGDSVSANNPYRFVVKEDTELWAHFTIGGYQVSVIAENGRIKSGGGMYAYNTEAEIEVVADPGYHFVKWTDGKGGNLSVDNPYRFVVKSDTTVQAHFAAGKYLVILSASNNGKLKSGTGGAMYMFDDEITVEAVADSGYRLAKWTDANGDSLSADNPYTFVVKSDMQVWARFAVGRYRVSLFAQNGRIKSGEGEYAYNTEAEAGAVADDDSCRFVKWVNAAGDSLSAANPYRFAVKEDVEMTAIFEKEGKGDTGNGTFPVGEARAYYAEDVLHLAGLEGFVVSVNTIDGRQILQFKADDAEHPAALPAGIYILNAASGKERYITKLVIRK